MAYGACNPSYAIDATLNAGAAGSPKAVKAQLRQVDAHQREFLVSRREGDLRRTCLHAVCAGAVLLKTSDADYAGVIEELCDAGADPNAARAGDATPLTLAARDGPIEVFKTLLHANADVNATDGNATDANATEPEPESEEDAKVTEEMKDEL